MKKWKRIIHNCPYLIALSLTWLFFTVGSGVLMWYRGYDGRDWRDFVSNPIFAVAVIEGMQGERTEQAVVTNDKNTKLDANEVSGELKWENSVLASMNQSEILQPDQRIIEAAKALENPLEDMAGEVLNGDIISDDIVLVNAESGSATEENDGSITEEKDSSVTVENDSADTESGKTRYETYTPIETDSIYYSDAGKIAYTTDYEYQKVTEKYFDDAAFLGDSRTLGIADYAGLDADFYCENGMTIYKLFDEKGITYQKNGQKVNLSQVLQQKQYGKIYIMLGMNELGYGDTERYLEQYEAVLKQIREWQPQAIIFILANLHVSQIRNNMKTEFNNVNINDKNAAAASLADGTNIFYLDSNPMFTDEEGFLKADLTFDGVHLYANNYEAWKEFFMEHGVVKNDEGSTGNSIK